MRGALFTGGALVAVCLAASAGVRINEISADANAREQQPWSNGLWRVGSEAPWHAPTYNHAAWPVGQGPFGFGTNRFVSNVQSSMQYKALSLYLLPRLKGALVAVQWAKRMHGFGGRS